MIPYKYSQIFPKTQKDKTLLGSQYICSHLPAKAQFLHRHDKEPK